MLRTTATLLTFFAAFLSALAFDLDYRIELSGNCGDGEFAPHYIMANRHGSVTQAKSALLDLEIESKFDTTQRFSFGIGAEAWAGASSSVAYDRLDPLSMSFYSVDQHPAHVWLQQIYAELKYRSIKLELGQKNSYSQMLNDELSSGDIIHSANSRPMPGANAGFVNYQNIPFTDGWVQIKGEIGYFRNTDNDWIRNHYNYYHHFITTDYWYNYKCTYFRTKPTMPLVLTVGMQAACQFGGTTAYYVNGENYRNEKKNADFSSFFHSLVPGAGGSNVGDTQYVEGNHVGSIDAMLAYSFHSGATVKAYVQRPWEDGSGMKMANGTDGLWGIEFDAGRRCLLSGAVVEYLDFYNQSGPIHWAPNDFPGTHLTNQATGSDDYYNNYAFNGYQLGGMSIGSPFVKAPIYNTDGYMAFSDNRMRGIHLAAKGYITPQLTYRAMYSYRKSWGSPFYPAPELRTCHSAMLEACYSLAKAPFSFKSQLGIDRGSLIGDNFGALVAVCYRGNFSF